MPMQPLPLMTQSNVPEPLQVTIPEAARLLSYDTRTIRKLIALGELAVVKHGRYWRVPTESLREYQERNRSQAPRPADHHSLR
jgi:excisionase family DNA binding protein